MIDWLTAGNEAIAAIAGDMAKFRRLRRSLPFIPYESLDPVPRHLLPDFRDLLEQRMTGAFVLGPHSIPSIVEPIDWPAQVRPFALHLDSWEPISELLMGHAIFDEDRYFAAALTFARGWMDSFHDASMAIGPDPVALDAAFGPMHWFDMSVGQRIYRLAYIADVMARDPRYGDTEVIEAMRSLVFHCQLLSVEAFYQGHNNHGFYQAIGELAACRRFSKLPFFRQRYACAVRRVRASIKQQFFPSGIHREHSPGYHLMVLGTLNGARESGLLAVGAIDEHVAACEEALSWLVQPGGMIVTFGDSDPRALNRGKYPPAMFRHPGLQYHASSGMTGEAPEPGIRVYKKEGYVFARSGPPGSGGTKWWYL
ncbi:MAG: hypothetical protein IT336_01465, partial [Thermomicrobiales bacterium]|nr:hypothetical protein [Thermomicrobiales bacterium]